jgi:hypothetical protein
MKSVRSSSSSTSTLTACSKVPGSRLRFEVDGEELEVPLDGTEVQRRRFLRGNAVAEMMPMVRRPIKGEREGRYSFNLTSQASPS